MFSQSACKHTATTVLLVATLFAGSQLHAQYTRVKTPGTRFVSERTNAKAEDVPGGRRFTAAAFQTVTLRGTLQMPSNSSTTFKMKRLIVHFRTSAQGPRLLSVEMPSGAATVFHIDTEIRGDYSSRETLQPKEVANVWDFGALPVTVSVQSVIRLKVSYPGGFDSHVDPGDFVLTSVEADFPINLAKKELDLNSGTSGLSVSPPRPPAAKAPVSLPDSNGIIYAVLGNNDLMWYRHDGRNDGSFAWASEGRKVGEGWDVKQIFSGGGGVIYTVTSGGDLMWYRHDGRGDGSFRWAADTGKKVGNGWNFKQVFSGGDGVIYAITLDGDLMWYRHDGYVDGSFRWAAPSGIKVGSGWNFEHVFAGDNGVIYAITAGGDLMWYRHDGRGDGSAVWAYPEGKKVGSGWVFKDVFSGGDGVIYGLTASNDLMWYRHDGREDGSFKWADPSGKKVGNGWAVKDLFSGANLAQ
jgi:Tachylectin